MNVLFRLPEKLISSQSSPNSWDYSNLSHHEEYTKENESVLWGELRKLIKASHLEENESICFLLEVNCKSSNQKLYIFLISQEFSNIFCMKRERRKGNFNHKCVISRKLIFLQKKVSGTTRYLSTPAFFLNIRSPSPAFLKSAEYNLTFEKNKRIKRFALREGWREQTIINPLSQQTHRTRGNQQEFLRLFSWRRKLFVKKAFPSMCIFEWNITQLIYNDIEWIQNNVKTTVYVNGSRV